jgi:hypothetical protein
MIQENELFGVKTEILPEPEPGLVLKSFIVFFDKLRSPNVDGSCIIDSLVVGLLFATAVDKTKNRKLT